MKKYDLILVLVFFLNMSAAAIDRHVSVFYYPWYDTERHWGEGYVRHLTDPPQEPLLGHYSNRDDAIVERHLRWSQDYGIDNWICSWWGPTSWENETIINFVSPNLQESGVTYCLFYESAGLLNMQNGRIDFDEARTTKLRDHFKLIAETFFDDPAYYKIDGRPVVYIYLTRTFGGDYANALEAVRRDMSEMGYDIFLVGDEVYWGSPNFTRIASLDAVTAYNMHGPREYDGYPMETGFLTQVADKYTTYRHIANLTGTAFIPKIMPGFNDRGVRLSADHYVIPTQVHPDSGFTSTFEQYAQLAERLIDSTLNAVCITSFNEWHEDTQIEPTIVSDPTKYDVSGEQVYTDGYEYSGYGTAYLDVVKEYFTGFPVGIEEREQTEPEFDISSVAYPNPFNESTEIYFEIFSHQAAKVIVFDLFGRQVRQMSLGRLDSGRHHISLNMSNQPSGIYFFRIYGSAGASQMNKIVLVK